MLEYVQELVKGQMLTPSGCRKESVVFSVPVGTGQAWDTELFLASVGSVLFTMATMATLRLTRRP